MARDLGGQQGRGGTDLPRMTGHPEGTGVLLGTIAAVGSAGVHHGRSSLRCFGDRRYRRVGPLGSVVQVKPLESFEKRDVVRMRHQDGDFDTVVGQDHRALPHGFHCAPDALAREFFWHLRKVSLDMKRLDMRCMLDECST